jgi:hypothetical protein
MPPPIPRKGVARAPAVTARQRAALEAARRQAALGTLSKADKAYVRRQARAFAYRSGDDLDDVRSAAMDYATRVGIAHFRAQVRIQQQAHRQYLGEANAGAYQSRGADLLDIWQADDGFPDVRWYYYH